MDNPKKLQVVCVIIVSSVTVKDVFGTGLNDNKKQLDIVSLKK